MSDITASREQGTATRAPGGAIHVQGGIRRVLLQKLGYPAGCTINMSVIEVQAGTNASPHTHPGIETGYVLGGEFTLVIEGRPDQHLTVGGSYAIPAGAMHYAKVPGEATLKVLCVFIVDDKEPLATVESAPH